MHSTGPPSCAELQFGGPRNTPETSCGTPESERQNFTRVTLFPGKFCLWRQYFPVNSVVATEFHVTPDLTLQKVFDTAWHPLQPAARWHATQRPPCCRDSSNVNTVGAKSGNCKQHGNPSSACYRCGKTNNSPDACYFKKQKCRACDKLGYVARMCKNRNKPPAQRTDFVGNSDDPVADEDSGDELPLLNVRLVKSNHVGSCWI